MELSSRTSTHNFRAFLWHATFLAFAQNFMDIDTILPAMIIESGGTTIHIGLMTVILLGGSSFTQLFFAPWVSGRPFKKRFLLAGINSRILSLFALGLILFYIRSVTHTGVLLWLIFLFITSFALGGAFTNISYTDILGKSVDELKRKSFFSAKQILAGFAFLISAFLARKILVASSYPMNYAWLFFAGGTLLLVASGGFWRIRESVPSMLKIRGFGEFIAILRSELKRNPRLYHYLGFINTQGIVISFLPFVMLYAKDVFDTQSSDTGNFLIFKVIGVVTVSMLVLASARRIKYNLLLYLNAGLSVGLVMLTLLAGSEAALKYIFILGGVVVTLYSITNSGLLLEISDRSNRAIYTGFAGAGHIVPALFPLAASWIIDRFGFQTFFMIFILIILPSIYFIFRVGCRK